MNNLIVPAIRCSLMFLVSAVAYAGSAQWNLNPTSADWNTAANWTPMSVPNGPADIATFALSNTTDVSISEDTEVDGITFTPATNSYAITVPRALTLTLSGTGITNNSGIQPLFIVELNFTGDGGLLFTNSASAGNASIWNGGVLQFSDNSTAGSAYIDSGTTSFLNSATADSAYMYNNFGRFSDSSTAGNALIFGDTGATTFENTSSAGSATITYLGGGAIVFSESSTGGTARITVSLFGGGSGFLLIDQHNAPGVTIGSIEGSGFAVLGANNLTVGSNDLSTTFSGVIEDNGSSGSLTKIGKGTLDLEGVNTYTGQTNVNGGVLQVDGSISNNTFINHKGALAGGGAVYGNVTNHGGEVSPGDPLGVPGVLTVSNNYAQTPSASLVIQIAGTHPGQVSVLNVLGNATLNGELDPELVNGFVPAIGQSFRFMNFASFTGSFFHIVHQVFDHGRKRWTLVYGAHSAYLVVARNGS